MQGPIIYAYTALEVDYHCTQILAKGPQAAGFDIEWRVTYKAGEVPRKTALLQLCSRDCSGSYRCWLLHIAHSGITPSLLQLLQSEVGTSSQLVRGGGSALYIRTLVLHSSAVYWTCNVQVVCILVRASYALQTALSLSRLLR